MIKQAYIEQFQPHVKDEEGQALITVLRQRGVETIRFTPKKLRRRWLNINSDTLVAGSVSSVRTALKQFLENDQLPIPNDYPNSLNDFTNRHIRRSTLRQLVNTVNHDTFRGAFIKPAGVSKRFTGRIVRSLTDIQLLSHLSLNTEIFISEIVQWQQEWRCFILDGEILGTRRYSCSDEVAFVNEGSNLNDTPPINLLRKMIDSFIDSEEGKRAFALDIGLLDSGQWALVEVNDAFALGRYGLNAEAYTNLILAGWEEMTKSK